MTLVLAVRSREGIVLASDGQATLDAAGQPVRRPVRKLFAVGRRIAWGAAGAVGLQQTLAAELARRERALVAAAEGEGAVDGAGDLRAALVRVVVPIQRRAVREFVPVRGAAPPELSCLFCWWGRDGPALLSIPPTGGDHQLHDDYCAVGSGDIFAAFAMASLGRLELRSLTLEQATVVAYQAVADAIEVAAVLLGPPIQMSVVTPTAGVLDVPRSQLERAGGVADAARAWRRQQRESLRTIGRPAATPPEVPAQAPALLRVLRAVRETA
jgi:20S proteasome alpha/beta subunit